jgi:hypothetical protein
VTSKSWLCLALCLGALPASAAPNPGGADQWLAGQAAYPAGIPEALVDSNRFAGLRAEAIASRLKISCPAENTASDARLTLYASADAPGHWPARDWRAYACERRGGLWDAAVLVEDLDVPVVYFAVLSQSHALGRGGMATNGAITAVSPLRVVTPRSAGLAEPTTLFWSFLEGFEEGLESWRVLAPTTGFAPLRTDAAAHTGRAALAVSVPAGKRSLTLATTCVRGRHLVQHRATGLRLWLRTRAGRGQARFTLHANAFAPGHVLAAWPQTADVTDQWQKVDLFFSALPQGPLGAVDFLVIELLGQGPLEFLIDDLQLLSPGHEGPE